MAHDVMVWPDGPPLLALFSFADNSYTSTKQPGQRPVQYARDYTHTHSNPAHSGLSPEAFSQHHSTHFLLANGQHTSTTTKKLTLIAATPSPPYAKCEGSSLRQTYLQQSSLLSLKLSSTYTPPTPRKSLIYPCHQSHVCVNKPSALSSPSSSSSSQLMWH